MCQKCMDEAAELVKEQDRKNPKNICEFCGEEVTSKGYLIIPQIPYGYLPKEIEYIVACRPCGNTKYYKRE